MKIIRLTTLLDFGGQEKQYISFTNRKDLLKYEYIFAAIGYGGFAEKNIRQKDFQVVIFDKNPAISNLKNIYTLYRWFRIIKPDIVHTAATEANFHGIIAAKLAGVKTIIAEEIGFPHHSKNAKIVFRQIYKFSNKVIAVSKSVRDFLVHINEITSDKCEVIYNPVTQSPEFTRSKQKDFTIISVGRFEIVKNQQLLIRSFSKINDKTAKLVLVGDGSERENLEKLIAELGLENRITITGFVENPGKYLAKSDLFVLPSLSEGFGIAAVEAIQAGVPTLCTSVGGIPEFVENGITGWLLDAKCTVEDLTHSLNYIISLPEEMRERISKMALNKTIDRFSEEKYIHNLENFYEQQHK